MIDETTMEHRRLERLSRLTFFMVKARLGPKARYTLSRSEAHNLLTGFFQNSAWAVAWWCVKQAAESSAINIYANARAFWQIRVLRLSDEEIERRMLND